MYPRTQAFREGGGRSSYQSIFIETMGPQKKRVAPPPAESANVEEAPAAAAADETPTAAVKTAAVEARAAAAQLLTDVEAFRDGRSYSYRSIFAETIGGPTRAPLARPQPPAPQPPAPEPPAPQAEAAPAANPPSRARQALYESRQAALRQQHDHEVCPRPFDMHPRVTP